VHLEHGVPGGTRGGAPKHAPVRRRETALEPGEERKRVEAVECRQHGLRRHGPYEPGQDRGLADLSAEPERRLLERENGDEPAERKPEEASRGDAADAVGEGETRAQRQKAADGLTDGGAHRTEDEGSDERPGKPGERGPGGVLREEMWRDDRAHDGPEDEAAQRKHLRRESAVEPEEGEDDDAEQEKCVGDVHAVSIGISCR
jgi:hypothetical protein